MYDRISRALEMSNLSNYLYRFKENEMDDEIISLCLQDATLVDELRNIIPVSAHLIRFKAEFKKTELPPQPFSYTHGQPQVQNSGQVVVGGQIQNQREMLRSSRSETRRDNSPQNFSPQITSRPTQSPSGSLSSATGGTVRGDSLKGRRTESPRTVEKKKDLRTELQEIFDAVDEDGSGRICVDELYKATTRSRDSRLSMDACRLMISMFDDDKRGSIDVMGFFSLILLVHDWQDAFQRFDADKSGHLDRRELIAPLQEIAKGYLFDQQFVDFIVARFGNDQGQLDSDGYINACAFISTFTKGFRQKDKSKQGIISYQDFLTVVLQAWN